MSRMEWTEHAACRGQDQDLWFPGRQHPKSLATINALAKSICAACPVIDRCLTYAMQEDITYGTWGGLTEEERSKIRGCYPTPSRMASTKIGPRQGASHGCSLGADKERPGAAETAPAVDHNNGGCES